MESQSSGSVPNTNKPLGIVGVVGRFKPLHTGSAIMLETLCEQAEEVIIGLGSCNKYNWRNPFTAAEVKEMIDLVLRPKYGNYRFIEVPDFAHFPEYADGKKWTEYVLEHYGKLDHFVCSNDYVIQLLKPHYDFISPASLIDEKKHVWVKGSMVRMEMARGGNWQALVPKTVAEYLEKKGLIERFRKEFGLETLGLLLKGTDYRSHEDARTEYAHTLEKSTDNKLTDKSTPEGDACS
jgi:nicotinamide-nucleotide adenylyltransferase